MENVKTNNSSASRSKILVIGATGGTGRLIVSQALALGHEVTALVRSPEKARELTGAKLIIGDAHNLDLAITLAENDSQTMNFDDPTKQIP